MDKNFIDMRENLIVLYQLKKVYMCPLVYFDLAETIQLVNIFVQVSTFIVKRLQ